MGPSKRQQKIDELRNRKFLCGVITGKIKPVYLSQSHAARITRIARRHGINPETHCYYPQLARYYGDPEAFVATRKELEDKIKARGLSIEDEA